MTTLLAAADPEALTRRLAELIQAGRTKAAHPLMAAVRRLAPHSPRLAELSARLAIGEGRLQDALRELDQALTDMPGQPGLLKCRADVRVRLDDFAGAAIDAADAVLADPQDPGAKGVLGLVLLELGRPEEAVRCLDDALAAVPDNASIRLGLAAALERAGDPARAAAALQDGIAITPLLPQYRRSLILLHARTGQIAQALAAAEAARVAGAADARVMGLLGHCLAQLGRAAEAEAAYADALKMAPDDRALRHMVAASGRIAGEACASAEYVRAVFDQCAGRFDDDLINAGCRVPGLMRDRLLAQGAAAGLPPGPVLDLGCGTGLLGVALHGLDLGPLVGVDLSANMLAGAAAKSLYGELHHAEMVAFLEADPRSWALVLAADVLCYCGTLEPALQPIAARLLPGGLCILSVERLADADAPPSGWRLLASGRYAHTSGYLQACALAAGLVMVSMDEAVLRDDPGGSVIGLLAVLRRPRHAA